MRDAESKHSLNVLHVAGDAAATMLWAMLQHLCLLTIHEPQSQK